MEGGVGTGAYYESLGPLDLLVDVFTETIGYEQHVPESRPCPVFT